MAVTLAELVDRLMEDVPARDSIPDALQYERVAKEAVGDLGRRAGRYKIGTLAIVSGTASYALPSDFVRLIKLESLIYPDNIMHTAAGLVPVPQSYSERTTISNGYITFYPTPAYAMTRYIHYQAGWALDAALSYAEMDEGQAEILLLEAQSRALLIQANYYAQQAWQYQIGDERVSKEKLATELRAQALALRDQYQAAAAAYNGAYGSRSELPNWSYGAD